MSSFPSQILHPRSLPEDHSPEIRCGCGPATSKNHPWKVTAGRSTGSNKKQGTGWKHVGKTFGWFRSFTNFPSCSEGSFYFETAHDFSCSFRLVSERITMSHLCHHGTTWRTCATKVRQLHLSAHRCEKSSATPTGQFSHPESWDMAIHGQEKK